jgi:hypothetical protein
MGRESSEDEAEQFNCRSKDQLQISCSLAYLSLLHYGAHRIENLLAQEWQKFSHISLKPPSDNMASEYTYSRVTFNTPRKSTICARLQGPNQISGGPPANLSAGFGNRCAYSLLGEDHS